VATFVSTRLLSGFLRNLSMQRIDVDALVGDLPIEWNADEPPQRTSLVDWDDVTELGTRLERRLGGPEALEDLGAAIAAARPMPAIRRLLGWTASPGALYRIGLRWLELHMPRELTTGLELLEDGRLEIQIEMPDTSRSCRPLFHMLAGAARSLPTLVDLPESVVVARIDTHSATLTVTPSTSGSLVRRTLRSVRTFLGSNEAIEDLEEERHLLRRHVDQLEHALFDATERDLSLRTLVEVSNELMLEVDEEGRIHTASESVQHVTGYSPAQIVGSHLSLWFHRNDDECIRRLIERAFAGEDAVSEHRLRARHERGRWLDATVDVRRTPQGDGPQRIVVAVRESTPEFAGKETAAALAARLQSLERRHRDLREMHPKLLEAERVAATREVADLIEASVGAAIGPLAEGLDVAAHGPPAGPADLSLLADLAHRIDDGLDRTVATLRRAKHERNHVSIRVLANSLRTALTDRLDGLASELHVDAGTPTLDGWVLVDADLVGAAFEHLAEHLADHLTQGAHVEAELRSDPGEDRVRVTLHGSGRVRRSGADAEIPVDLELARGILRGQGGDVVRGGQRADSAPDTQGERVEIWLPIGRRR